jgi:gamma-glutamyltranspeptidase
MKEGARDGDTEYVAAADSEGNLVSFIQSNFMGFGSGIVEPETGIILQNRGALFSLEENHPNCVGPHKRCVHTLEPAFPQPIRDELIRRGRTIVASHAESFGGAHAIMIHPESGAFVGGSDPRKGGCALGF